MYIQLRWFSWANVQTLHALDSKLICILSYFYCYVKYILILGGQMYYSQTVLTFLNFFWNFLTSLLWASYKIKQQWLCFWLTHSWYLWLIPGQSCLLSVILLKFYFFSYFFATETYRKVMLQMYAIAFDLGLTEVTHACNIDCDFCTVHHDNNFIYKVLYIQNMLLHRCA